MNAQCFSEHPSYLKKWPNGISVCILCAAKSDLAQNSQTLHLRTKLHELVYSKVTDDHGEKESENILTKCKCLRCSHVWLSRVDKPKSCPACRSYRWDIPAKKSEGK